MPRMVALHPLDVSQDNVVAGQAHCIGGIADDVAAPDMNGDGGGGKRPPRQGKPGAKFIGQRGVEVELSFGKAVEMRLGDNRRCATIAIVERFSGDHRNLFGQAGRTQPEIEGRLPPVGESLGLITVH